jgi:hypothetical protein
MGELHHYSHLFIVAREERRLSLIEKLKVTLIELANRKTSSGGLDMLEENSLSKGRSYLMLVAVC